MVVATTVQSLTVLSADQMKANFLRTIKNGLIEQGYPNPNVSTNSYWDLVGSGFSNEGSIIGLNVQLVGDQLMPDTAQSTYLDRWLNFFGIVRRLATSAIGGIIVTSTNSTFVPAGTQILINGIRYAVQLGGIYGNGAQIVVQAVDVGSDTNQDAGTTFTWVQTPTYFQSTGVVSSNYPISGGIDNEDDETARDRLSTYLSNSPGAANASQIAQWAIQSDPSVQFGVVYPAARGPATVDASVFTYATSTSQNRTENYTIFGNIVSPYILGNLPLGMDGYVSNVVNYPLDVVIALSLPAPSNASPPGPGGGFLDPVPLQTTSAKPAIRVVDGYAISGNDPTVPQNTSIGFWVDFPVAPTAGLIYNISYVSPATLVLTSAQTSGVNLLSSAYASLSSHTTLQYVSINVPFYNDAGTNLIIQPGEWIFPTANNTAVYVSTFLTYMAGMGPGERTSNPGLLLNGRAYRQPTDIQAFPYKLNTRMIKTIIESGNEVLDGLISYRGIYTNGGFTPVPNGESVTDSTTFTDYGTITTGGDPAYAVYAPPTAYNYFGTALGDSLIFTPNNFAIYPQV